MKVLIGTKNSGKIKGAKAALENFFEDVEIESVSAQSNVSEQPVDGGRIVSRGRPQKQHGRNRTSHKREHDSN